MNKYILLFLIAILVTGCATLFSGSNDQVSFTSDPPNIKVYKDTRLIGSTPLTITVKRVGMASGKLKSFKFVKQGYKSQEFTLSTEFNNVALLNNITVVSWLTDFFTGSVTQYSPNEYHVILESELESNAADFAKRNMAQQYILLYFYDLVDNAYNESGIHIDNLIKILKIKNEKRDEFLSLLKSNIKPTITPPEFIVDLDAALKKSFDLNKYAFL